MANSPTQLTLKKWRKMGYQAEVVEKTIPKTFIKKDLFGFVDVLCVGKNPETGSGETVAVQTTSYGNVSARVKKIEDMPAIVEKLRDAGWRIIVEGWHKPGNRWVCREVDIS